MATQMSWIGQYGQTKSSDVRFREGRGESPEGPYPYPPPPPPPRPARQSQVLILTGLELSATHFHEIWPALFTHAEATVPALVTKPAVRKGAGGVKGNWKWEAYLIEAAAYMYSKQSSGDLVEVTDHLRTWACEADGGPGETAMKDHISPLWNRFREIDGC